MPKKLKAKSNKHYDWEVMADIYITTALLLAEQLPHENFYNSPETGSEVTTRLGLHSAHPNYELILPLIYNFKHGVELYIKALGIIDFGEYDGNHDFKILLTELKKSTKSTKNEATIKQLYNDTWPTIKKYYYGRYIPSKKRSNFADKKMQAERYPEYKNKKNGKIYRITEKYKWVTKTKVEEIEKDIKLIETKFKQAWNNIKPTKKFIYGRTKK